MSLEESNSLKGIALILLLIHHLFYISNGMYEDFYINGKGIINVLGIVCKACVPIFVLLSGYGLGLTIKNTRHFDIIKFYKRRFIKLFLNYWLIWLIFVPVGIIFFNRTFDEVYGEKTSLMAVLDFFGVLNLTGRLGYNPTWWFYSCIILLYLIFPLIAITVAKKPKIIWVYLIASILLIKVRLTVVDPIRYYLFPFVFGIVLSNNLIYNKLSPPPQYYIKYISSGVIKITKIIVLLTLLITASIIRLTVPLALLWDTLIAMLIILFYKSSKNFINLDKGFGFIGKHSFNIFLFHTFIYYLYFPMLIYWSKNPIVIFISLLLSSMVISVGIEKLKKLTGFYKAQEYLINIRIKK